ncbi:M56 family metallopeptidase [Salinibacter altiplanensis]|uniref:M56 family metallopeptidase n=1 Tax=Salinibacter altiplanensis TaxID=1803181 RepID=UPI000C9ED5E5|nr:M56 family metallopeptidase [Salinibacter altiplanensis]
MIQVILETLADLGSATTPTIWGPVLAWTLLALPLWVFLKRTDRLHPLAEYRLSQVLLAALPISIAAVGIVDLLPASPAPPLLPDASVLMLPAVESTTTPPPGGAWRWHHATGALTVLALAVGAYELARLGGNAVALGRVRDRVLPATMPALQEELDRLRDRLEIRRPVRVCATSNTAVPVTLGGRRPVILVPKRLTEAPDAFRMTLHHELVHIRRWDDVAQFVERVVAALFAVHPLVSRLRRRIDGARERACDAAVLTDKQAPTGDYARLLATFADGSGPRRLGALSLSESPSSLKDRLSAMRSSIPSLLSTRLPLVATLVAGGLALTLSVVACSDSVAPSASTDDPTATESSSASAKDGKVFMVVEDPPKLVGGMSALQESISYPEAAKEAGIEGRVIVQFIVDENGAVTNPTVTRSVQEGLDQAALDAVKAQEFKPGQQDGEAVKVQLSLPVTFRVPDDSGTTSSHQPTAEPRGNSATAGLDASHFERGSPVIDRKTREPLHCNVSPPKLAQKAGMEGRARVDFAMNSAGQATNPRISNERTGLDSPPDLLAQSALRAVKDVTFTSEGRDGFSGQQVGVAFQFRLPEEKV